MLPPRRRRRGRKLLWAAGALLLAPLLGYGALVYAVSGEGLRQRLVAAVESATGRDFTLGELGVKLSLVPTITLESVSLAGEAGQPPAFKARRVEAEIALLPLLSRQVALHRLSVIEPVLRVSTGEATPEGDAATAPERRAGPLGGEADFAIAEIEIERGRLIWRDALRGRSETIEIRRLSLTDREPGGPAKLSGHVSREGYGVDLAAEMGPLSRLLPGAAPGEPWPLRIGLQAEGMQAVLEGAMSRPARLSGLNATLHLTLDNAARLASMPFLAALPQGWIFPAEGLFATVALSRPEGEPGLHPGALRVGAASVDLSRLSPGLVLRQVELAAPTLAAPLRLSALMGKAGSEARLAGEGPSPDALEGEGPWPLRLTLEGPGARLSATGRVNRAGLAGSEASLALEAEDLAPSLALLGIQTAPEAAPLAVRGRGLLSIAEDGTIALADLALEGPPGDLAGSLAFRPGERPFVAADLRAERFSSDMLARIMSAPGASPPAAPPLRGGEERLIPALPMNLAWLRAFDADAKLQAAAYEAGGITWRELVLTAQLKEGVLKADPVAVTVPGGRVAGRVGADARGEPPAVSLALRHEGPGLDMAQLLPALGYTGRVTGRLELDADLSARGGDLRAMAQTLSGHLGLASAGGSLDNSLIEGLSPELRQLLLPQGLGRGANNLRCLALRLEGAEGLMRPRAMLLETTQLSVLGSGQIDLGRERLALRLLPQIKVVGLGVTAPLRVSGSFLRPAYELDTMGVPGAAAGILGELVGRTVEGIGTTTGLLAENAFRSAGADCAPQLAIARGRPAPRPAATGNRPQDLLRGLIGR